MRIIPAIDLIDGKCVRLSQGDYNQKKVYDESPVEVAKRFEDAGIQYLHLVDLDGAKSNGIVNWRVLAEITNQTNLKVDFGGGLKSDRDLKVAFENGAAQVTGGSIAVSSPEVFEGWIEKYGSDRIILGADAKNEKIAVNGWKESTKLNLGDFISTYRQKGIEYVICTDIAKDGMLSGSSNALYKRLLKDDPEMKLIASGGVTSIGDLDTLYKMGCDGAIIGKAIYENKITLKELQLYVD